MKQGAADSTLYLGSWVSEWVVLALRRLGRWWLAQKAYPPYDFKTLSFYQNNATRYAVRDAKKGLTNELSALGAESAKNFVKGIPDAVKNLGLGLWEALNPVNFKNDLVSNKNTILEGSKIAFSSDLTTLMNRLYGQDVGDVQKALLVYSAVDAVRSSSGVGRLGNVVSRIGGAGDVAKGPLHHICTNKNCVSTTNGGPWTPRFESIFEKAGMNLDDALNKVRVPGHKGPHPEAYHLAVFDRLTTATDGLSGSAYKNALQAELKAISKEANTSGSMLNKSLTKQ